MNKDKQVVWRESIRKYGKEIQSIVCMEECSELIQAVSKCLRGKPDVTDNLAEEMADVTICLHMLQEMYGITDAQLEEWIARKTARQSKRMQADDPFLKGEDAKGARTSLFSTPPAAGECSGSTSQTAVCSSVTCATKVGNYVTDADSRSSRTC